MSILTLKRIIRAGLQDFLRNAFVSLASILVMTVTLFIFGVTIFTGVILQSSIQQLRDSADVSVYMVPDAPEEQILSLKDAVSALPEVASVEYLSQKESLAQFRLRHQDNQLILQSLDELGNNPLNAELVIKAKDSSQYNAIAQFLKTQRDQPSGQAVIEKISYLDDLNYRQALDKLESIALSAQKIGYAIMTILILTTLAICFNTLRLAIYTSREEISVMRLMGAGHFYIRAPFVVEGMLYGLVSGITTMLLFYPVTYWLGEDTSTFFGSVNIFNYYLNHSLFFSIAIVGSGMAIGALASYLAVRRYLKI